MSAAQHAVLLGAYQPPMRVVDSADFDGVNDVMTRGAGLTGAADGKKGLLSLWFRMDGAASNATILHFATTVGGAVSRFRLRKIASGVLEIIGINAAGATILDLNTTSTFTTSATWRHIMASWDLGTPGAREVYVDGVSEMNQTTFTDDSIDYTTADFAVGDQAVGATTPWPGCLAEVYMSLERLDLTVLANRRKFRSASGKPVHLGASGQFPTGNTPIAYFHLDDGEAVANFATNRGSGGDLTIAGGGLATGSTSPSD